MAAAEALPNAPTSASCAPPSAAGACCARKPIMPVSGGAPGAAAATRGGGALAPERPKRERRLVPGESGARGAWDERGEEAPRGAAAGDAGKCSKDTQHRFTGRAETPGDPPARASRALGERRAGAKGAGLEGDARMSAATKSAGAVGGKDAVGTVHAQGNLPQSSQRVRFWCGWTPLWKPRGFDIGATASPRRRSEC